MGSSKLLQLTFFFRSDFSTKPKIWKMLKNNQDHKSETLRIEIFHCSKHIIIIFGILCFHHTKNIGTATTATEQTEIAIRFLWGCSHMMSRDLWAPEWFSDSYFVFFKTSYLTSYVNNPPFPTGFSINVCSRVALMWINFQRLIFVEMKTKQKTEWEKKRENDSAWQF